MLVDQQNIERYIPQRPPIVMVGALLQADEKMAMSSFEIRSGNIFVSGDSLQEPGLIENIAQTAAAHAGYYYIENELPVPIGFIAAIRNLKIASLPKIGETITTTVAITNKVMDVTIIEGSVSLNQSVICSCEMRIFIKPS
jgi:predicted hotdog family 3-hydroxylacyl-ACP dehydratase